jgi:hypothetical protein
MKQTLMIHEVSEWMFDLPLHEYILTFDDGLYTQYKYIDLIDRIETEKIFFISTNIVAGEGVEQIDSFISCSQAHEIYFNTGELKYYMNWSQIKDISRRYRCSIGGHSHYHTKRNIKTLANDTRLMCKAFKQQELYPDSFCFPYNDDCEVYKRILLNHGFKKFYGKDRIDINDL